jgi:hypothetical protein
LLQHNETRQTEADRQRADRGAGPLAADRLQGERTHVQLNAATETLRREMSHGI